MDSSSFEDPNLRWGTTKTANDETIRVLFVIDKNNPIGKHITTPPAYRTIITKLNHRDKNLYFKLSTLPSCGEHSFSKYYIFHSFDSEKVTNNDKLIITIGNKELVAVRIVAAHKKSCLYHTFQRAKKTNDWQNIQGYNNISVLYPNISLRIHLKIVDEFVKSGDRRSSYSGTPQSSSNLTNESISSVTTSRQPKNKRIGNSSLPW